MIVDSHAHIATWPTVRESEWMILESQKRYGVAFSLLSDCDCSEYPSLTQWGVHKIDQIAGLKTVLKFVKEDPGKLGALLWINPHNEIIRPELLALIEKNRPLIYGLKFHPFESHLKITSPKLIPYLELARRYVFPILVHTAEDRYSDVAFLGEVAARYPDLTFIAAHLQLVSSDNHRSALEVLKGHPNVYGDTAWVEMKTAKKILETIGEDRVMFGTDNPIDGVDTLNNPMYQAYFKNKVKLPSRLYHNLMSRNAIKVFKLPLK
jgi:predicted TIM-barrel fold metal-dependent hydrolase